MFNACSLSRMAVFVFVSFLSSALINNEQSFSMYMPYADTTMVWVGVSGHLSITICEHWACTALYNASPVRFAMLVPPVRFDVDHMELMSPAISSVPWVDNDLFLMFDNTALMPDNALALLDVSLVADWAYSPAVADVMAFTSAAVLSMTVMFKL